MTAILESITELEFKPGYLCGLISTSVSVQYDTIHNNKVVFMGMYGLVVDLRSGSIHNVLCNFLYMCNYFDEWKV